MVLIAQILLGTGLAVLLAGGLVCARMMLLPSGRRSNNPRPSHPRDGVGPSQGSRADQTQLSSQP
jgi:hypothetical protein